VNNSLETLIDIWFCDVDATECDDDEIDSILSPGEKARAKRFAFDHLRRRYRICHAALRKVIATYMDQDPSDLNIETLEHGKPRISGGPDFNMSSSGPMLLIGIGEEVDLGVDVESIKEMVDMEQLAGRYFSQIERAELDLLPRSELLSAFFRIWARKEAVTKAVGLGLNMDLTSFSVPTDDMSVCSRVDRSDQFPSRSDWFIRPFKLFDRAEAAIAASKPVDIAKRFRIGHGIQWAEDN